MNAWAVVVAALIGAMAVFGSAFLAALAALAGAWMGNRLQTQSRLQQWQLDRRADAYDELRVQAHKFARIASAYFQTPVAATRQAVEDGLWELDTAATRVELIAPAAVVHTARALLDCASDTIYPMSGIGVTVSPAQRKVAMDELGGLTGAFFDAARKDVRGTSAN